MQPEQCSAVTAACAALQDFSQRELKAGVQLSERGACYAQSIPQQCDREDHCILGCLLNGHGGRVAGGCWRLSHYPVVSIEGETFDCSAGLPVSPARSCEAPVPAEMPASSAH